MTTRASCLSLIIIGGAWLAGCSHAASLLLPTSPTSHGTASARVGNSTTSYRVLHFFGSQSNPPDGHEPWDGFFDVEGTLYGTTTHGGENNNGTVFTLTPSGAETVLHSFINLNVDGGFPAGSLIGINGTLYGTTTEGGAQNYGTVFSITTSGKFRVLHSFAGGSDGANPYAGLSTLNGVLYGTTYQGGPRNAGTVFSVTTSGTEKVLRAFGGRLDGEFPIAGLIHVNGTFYGTTTVGGPRRGRGGGTVFSITPTGIKKILYSFGAGTNDGQTPQANLVYVNGKLYGTTIYGGAYGSGTVFSTTTAPGTEHVLHSFSNSSSDGGFPTASLIDAKGTLYGTTNSGGAYDDGTIFSISTSGTERVLYSFSGPPSDGDQSHGRLLNINGVLYGMTVFGGACSTCGVAFSILP